jgi:Type II secretion system (T2SS), protein E, N-terminal domain
MSTPLRERPDAPLGTLIFRAGLLPAETIENALEEGVKTGRRLGEILIERGLLQEEDLTRLLAGQKGLPFVSLRGEQIDPEAIALLSQDQARLFSALPIRFEEGVPLIAVADPTNDVLNRNIREALGQDVRFVVAGRTELNDVIGNAYSGVLPSFAPAAPEPLESPPLRVDTSIAPAPDETPPPSDEAEPETAPESDLRVAPEQEPAPESAAPDQESAPEPAPLVQAEPEPVFEAAPEPAVAEPEPAPEPVFEAAPEPAEAEPEPAPEPIFEAEQVAEAEPELAPEPEPAPAPEPLLEPVAVAEETSAPQAFDAPPIPKYEQPAAPAPEPEPVVPAAEPEASQTAAEANGHVPHELLEDDLLPSEPATTVDEAPAAEPTPDPARAAVSPNGGYRVSIRLTSGERLTVSECADLGEAKGYAKALTKQLGVSDPDDWPFVNGRFLKPDTIVSVDVEPS